MLITCIHASHVATFVFYGYILALRTALVFCLHSFLNPFLLYCFRLCITCPQLRMTCHLGASRWLSRASFTSSSIVTAVLLQKSWPSLLGGTLMTLSCSMMFKNWTGFFVKNWKIRWRYRNLILLLYNLSSHLVLISIESTQNNTMTKQYSAWSSLYHTTPMVVLKLGKMGGKGGRGQLVLPELFTSLHNFFNFFEG